MKKIIYLMFVMGFLASCKKDQRTPSEEPVAIVQSHPDQSLLKIKLISQNCLTEKSLREISKEELVFSSVNIDIQKVCVFIPDKGWLDLDVIKGVYDLIALQNEIGTMITENTMVQPEAITLIKMVFGNNHSIVKDDRICCLKLMTPDYTFETTGKMISGTLGQLTILFDFCQIHLSNPGSEGQCYVLEPLISSKNYEEII